MSIIKSNNAKGAFGSVAEWVSEHINGFQYNPDFPEASIKLLDDGYDIKSASIWLGAEIIFKPKDGEFRLSLPKCLSKQFLNRIRTITIYNQQTYIDPPDGPEYYDQSLNVFSASILYHTNTHASGFDISQLSCFPQLDNLQTIRCYLPDDVEDIEGFIKSLCDAAHLIHPTPNKLGIVEISIADRKNTDLGHRLRSLDKKYLRKICLERCDLENLTLHVDYFNQAIISNVIRDKFIKNFQIVGEQKLKEIGDPVTIKNSIIGHLDPGNNSVCLNNSKIINLKDLVKTEAHIVPDMRSMVKSGLGAEPVTSTAIDMFGRSIHVGDWVAHISLEGIEFDKVKIILGENVDLTHADTDEEVCKICDKNCWVVDEETIRSYDKNKVIAGLYMKETLKE